jgi:hypothetical protein
MVRMAETPVLVRLYFGSHGFLVGLTRFLSLIHNGFWLGVLTRKHLHSISEKAYERNRKYWTDDYNKSGLWGWESRVVERHFAGCKRVLLAAAGGGREVLALRRLGLEVDGFEANPGLVRVANELLEREGFAPDIALAVWDESPNYEAKYDGIIVGWGAYTHIRGKDKRVAFLHSLRERVGVGAPILLSFHGMNGNSGFLRRVSRLGNLVARVLSRDRVEVGDRLIPDYAHFFSRQQVESELQESGFELIAFETAEYGHSIGRAV